VGTALAEVTRRQILAALAGAAVVEAAPLPSSVLFLPGPINGLLVNEKVLVYGDANSRVKGASHVLFTHARRDVVWAGVPQVTAGAAAIVPRGERELFANPKSFWEAYETARFHDYSQVNTKVLREPLPVTRAVTGGDVLDLDGTRVEVIGTPGYTRGAVSYWMEIGGKRIACTGDLIYSDGQLLDLSSLQDAIPEAKARGYHGYAARAGDLIESLRKIASRKPDVLVPARGPLIENPQAAITRLIARLQALMASHFATDALLWYWGEENLRIRSRKALDGRPVDSMPMAEQRALPAWALAIGNSRLLLSQTGDGFVIDAGYKGLPPKLEELHAAGQLKTVEGMWITHYHDDHTDYAQQVADRFHCPVYCTARLKDILERPGDYRLPCLTPNRITSDKPQADGTHLRWHEFELTFFEFPGQTLYHYCLQNRDFARAGEGFLYCLEVLGRLPSSAWLINQHVEPMFRFSVAQQDRMRTELMKRITILREMAPWPDLNYAIDESWAAVHPYGSTVRPGERVTLEIRIFNHAPHQETYRVAWNIPLDWRLIEADKAVAIPAQKEATARAIFTAGGPGLQVVTADIGFAGRQLREWTEALVRINPGLKQ
jgi:glyoxylase-like metal-dependent hydrolase (beta-lactamase superfamily II)